MITNMKSTLIVRMTCALLFVVLTFFYLYDYQAGVLAMAQHVLSNGQTVYNRTIGAVLITLTMYLLHLGVYAITRLKRRTYALTYFPSVLILTLITDISPNIDRGIHLGGWWLTIPLLLIIFVILVYVAKEYLPLEQEIQYNGFWSQMMWMNLLQLVAMFMFLGLFSNHDDIFHYRMNMEQRMIKGDFVGALKEGSDALSTDSSLTMLRIWSLSKTGQLPERLFWYPVVGGSRALLPDSVTTKAMVYPEDSILWGLGVKYIQKMTPMHYLKFMEEHHVAKAPARDYLLMGYLLDKDLDGFVDNLGKYYKINGKLPKHYREALVLYTHRRAHPHIVYHLNVMDADFQDYQTMEHQYTDPRERQNMLHDTYGNTYWYYWQYGNK